MCVVSVTSECLNRRNHLTCWFVHRRHLFRCLAAGSLFWWNWIMLILMGWALLLLKMWSPVQHFFHWEKNDWFSFRCLEGRLPSHNRLFLLLLLILAVVSLASLYIFFSVTCSLRNVGANKTTYSNFTTHLKKKCTEFSMDFYMAASFGFHISQLGFELGAALFVSQDLCLSHLCCAHPLGHQIIAGQPPANEQQSHMTWDSHSTFISD